MTPKGVPKVSQRCPEGVPRVSQGCPTLSHVIPLFMRVSGPSPSSVSAVSAVSAVSTESAPHLRTSTKVRESNSLRLKTIKKQEATA